MVLTDIYKFISAQRVAVADRKRIKTEKVKPGSSKHFQQEQDEGKIRMDSLNQ